MNLSSNGTTSIKSSLAQVNNLIGDMPSSLFYSSKFGNGRSTFLDRSDCKHPIKYT